MTTAGMMTAGMTTAGMTTVRMTTVGISTVGMTTVGLTTVGITTVGMTTAGVTRMTARDTMTLMITDAFQQRYCTYMMATATRTTCKKITAVLTTTVG